MSSTRIIYQQLTENQVKEKRQFLQSKELPLKYFNLRGYLPLQQALALAAPLFISASLWQDSDAAASFLAQHSFLVSASPKNEALVVTAISFLQQALGSLHSLFPPV
jgi:hypothetical protein